MKSIESVKTLKYKMGIRIQTVLKIRPASMCLVTGCPRSGTSAILSWLNQNKGVVRFYESRILVSAHRFYSEIERFNNLNQNKEFFLGEIRKLVLKYYDSKKLLIAKHLIDKEPLEPIAFPDLDYALFLSNLREIFPDIKLLFMVRNPVETIWSMMNRKWGYTLTSQELRQFTLDECIQTWNACAGLAQKYAKRKRFLSVDLNGSLKTPRQHQTKF